MLAAFAQFDNDCRSDRTRAGMKAALELGRWVFLAPLGYLNAPRAPGQGTLGLTFEVTSREGASGTGLQVPLEAEGGGLVREPDDDVNLPGATRGCV